MSPLALSSAQRRPPTELARCWSPEKVENTEGRGSGGYEDEKSISPPNNAKEAYCTSQVSTPPLDDSDWSNDTLLANEVEAGAAGKRRS